MPEKKEPPILIIFLLLSLLLHLGLAYRYRAWEPAAKTLEELRKKRKKDIPVQIIELPPKKKKPETPKPPPKKPSFLADRNQQTKIETRTEEISPKPKVVAKPVKPQPKPKPRPKPKPPTPPKPKVEPRPQEQAKPQSKPEKPPVKDDSALTKAQPPSKKPEKVSAPKKKEPEKKQPDIKKLFPSADELLKYTEERQRRPTPSAKQSPRLPNKLKRGTEISLNTLDYKFHSYYLALKRKIELVWEYPYKARQTGAQGRLQMRFVINQDGSLAEVKILHSSGVAILDHEAVRAIQNASPFPPLPERMNTERLAVTATFEYLLSYRSVH